MPYENFPYADIHSLNLDWLLKQVKEDHDYLTGIDFEPMVDAAVQEAIDDGRMAALINDTLLAGISSRVTALYNRQIALEDSTYSAIASGKLALLGCPAANTLDAARGYSLCIVMHGENWCIVYDMGNDNCATLINYLSANNIDRIDAFIISHYHSDHYQQAGINALYSAGIQIDEWYLPHGAIDWGSYIGTPSYSATQTGCKVTIGLHGGTYIEPVVDGYEVELSPHHPEDPRDNIRIQFFNVTGSQYSDYYSYQKDEDYQTISHTNYNNFSMCCRIFVGRTVIALTGDIELPAQDKMAKMIKAVDILQIPHHGLNLIDSEKFRSSMSGKLFLTAAYGVARDARLKTISNLMLHHARELGTSVSNVDGNTVLCEIGNSVYVNPTAAGTVTPAGFFGDVLRPGADLDDLIEIGRVYFIQNASDASGISNIPESGAGHVYICSTNQNSNDTTGSIMQYYEASFSYAHPKIYVRWKYEGTWTAWKQYEATSI